MKWESADGFTGIQKHPLGFRLVGQKRKRRNALMWKVAVVIWHKWWKRGCWEIQKDIWSIYRFVVALYRIGLKFHQQPQISNWVQLVSFHCLLSWRPLSRELPLINFILRPLEPPWDLQTQSNRINILQNASWIWKLVLPLDIIQPRAIKLNGILGFFGSLSGSTFKLDKILYGAKKADKLTFDDMEVVVKLVILRRFKRPSTFATATLAHNMQISVARKFVRVYEILIIMIVICWHNSTKRLCFDTVQERRRRVSPMTSLWIAHAIVETKE